jgi:hypothetical protein
LNQYPDSHLHLWSSEKVGVVKIHVAAVAALRKKERGDETQFATKIGGEN